MAATGLAIASSLAKILEVLLPGSMTKLADQAFSNIRMMALSFFGVLDML